MGLDWAGLGRPGKRREREKKCSELKKHEKGPVPGLAW